MVKFDQRRFGLVSKKEEQRVQKPTILCTNTPSVSTAFQGKFCLGNHTHSVIQGSEGGMKRSTWASHYLLPMAESLATAVLQQWDDDHEA